MTDATEVIADIAGYFAPEDGTGRGLTLSTIFPCRAVDTRDPTLGVLGAPIIGSNSIRTLPLGSSSCGIPSNARAHAFDATVLPQNILGFLSVWPANQAWPSTSLLNSLDGAIVGNGAIVPSAPDGGINVYVTDSSHVLLDLTGYFTAPSTADTPKGVRSAEGSGQKAPVLTNGAVRTYTWFFWSDYPRNTRKVLVRDIGTCSVSGSGVTFVVQSQQSNPNDNRLVATVSADYDASPGDYSISCTTFSGFIDPIAVYDVTPVVNSIANTPNTTRYVFSGIGFGKTPPRLIFCPLSIQCFSPGQTNPGDTNAIYTISPGVTPTTFIADIIYPSTRTMFVFVRSNGNNGVFANGPAELPSSPTSNAAQITLRSGCLSLTIEDITADPAVPGDDSLSSLPVYNPATLRVGGSAFFWAKRDTNCNLNWTVVSGPGFSPFSSDPRRPDTTRQLQATSEGTILFAASAPGVDGAGTITASVSVPVVQERVIPIRLVVVRGTNGQSAAASEAKVQQDFAAANLLWQQVGIRFQLVPNPATNSDVWYIDSDEFLDPVGTQVANTFANTGGFEAYYVRDYSLIGGPDSTTAGYGPENGAFVCMANNPSNRVLAHELGHALLGGGHSHLPESLMYDTDLRYNSDLSLSERSVMLQRAFYQHQ